MAEQGQQVCPDCGTPVPAMLTGVLCPDCVRTAHRLGYSETERVAAISASP